MDDTGPADGVPGRETTVAIPADEISRRETAALAACLGLLSQAVQILLLRQFLTITRTGELVVGGAMAVWLVGWGGGCLVAERSRRPVTAGRLWTGLVLLVLVAWGFVAGIANGRELLSLPPHSPLTPASALGLAALFLTVPALLAGSVFGALTRALEPAEARRTYLIESCGSLAVGVFLSTPLWERPGMAGTFVILAVLLAAVRVFASPSRSRAAPFFAVAALACVAIVASDRALDRPWTRLLPGATVLERRELRQGAAVVIETNGQRSVFVGGHLADSWPSRQERESPVALALLQHPSPARVLLWGGRASLFASPARALGAREVTVLVEDRALLDFEIRHFAGLDQELSAPGVTVAVSELRAFLRSADARFDVIVLDSPDPATALANRVFTVEGLRLARAALAPGGVLMLPLASSSSAGTLGPEFKARNLALVSTLKSVFDEVGAVPGEEEYLLARLAAATGQNLCLDGRALARRLASRPPLAFLTPDQLSESVPRIPTMRLAKTYGQAPACVANTDDRPVGSVLSNRAEAEVSERGGRVTTAGLWGLALVLLALVGALVGPGARKRPGARRPLVSLGLLTGVGMVCQVLLFLMFQTTFGSLYREIGLITGLALGGVAIGSSALADRWRRAGPLRSLRGVAIVTAGSAGVVGALPRLGSSPVLAYGAMLFLAAWMGMLGGRAFALCLEEAGEGARIAPRAYAVDMLGAATGAVLTAGLLAPTIGVALTAGCGLALALVAALVAPRSRG